MFFEHDDEQLYEFIWFLRLQHMATYFYSGVIATLGGPARLSKLSILQGPFAKVYPKVYLRVFEHFARTFR